VQLGCRSVAFTYNDPVIFLEYAIDVAQACREAGVRTVAVTAGEITDAPRAELFRHIDAVNVDLKAFTERFYHRICAGRLQPVLETLAYIRHETDVWMEITNLVIPGENDSEEEIEAMSAWIVERLGPDVPVHFSAFHPDYKMLEHARTPPETLRRSREIARRNGVRHAYTGNIHDADGDRTLCHDCGRTVIRRDWYDLTEWGLDAAGRCPSCGTRCAGRFDETPGNWGRKRQPVRLSEFEACP
jgi:pyruvate formate lyase activating enzyme